VRIFRFFGKNATTGKFKIFVLLGNNFLGYALTAITKQYFQTGLNG